MITSQAATRLNRAAKAPTWLYSTSRSHTQAMNAQVYNQTLNLPDGRVLGYAEFGHPEGTPVLWFHGFPSSRLEAWGADKVARRRRLRLIAIDRPGFGLSTYQPGRRITDWPADVLAFANHANLKRFAVLGGSGGGPYALACAYKLPREMMTAVGVMAGAPPWEAGVQQVSWYRRVVALAAIHTPTGLRVVMDALVGLTRWIVYSGPVTRRIDKWLESVREKEKLKAEAKAKADSTKQGDGETVAVDEEVQSTIAESREWLMRLLFDGFAQGSRATVQEARLLSAYSWGFKFEDVSYDPVLIWHGTKDANAPFSMIQYMSNRLPHSNLREFEGDTHYSMGYHLEQILKELETSMESKKTV